MNLFWNKIDIGLKYFFQGPVPQTSLQTHHPEATTSARQRSTAPWMLTSPLTSPSPSPTPPTVPQLWEGL